MRNRKRNRWSIALLIVVLGVVASTMLIMKTEREEGHEDRVSEARRALDLVTEARAYPYA